MKTLNLLSALVLSIFLIASVSAITTSYGEWNDQSEAITISNGANADFNFYFTSTNPLMNMNIQLYDSSNNPLGNPFLDESTSGSFYFNSVPYTITPTMYGGVGTYDLRFYSIDNHQVPSIKTITLTVNPASAPPTPTNNAPVITSAAITNVNESVAYSYQVVATDADGNTLTYSLTQAPSWLSINSATGLITGTAPSVTSNTASAVIIRVSDGITYVEQSYTLTVYDTSVPPTPPANTAPVFTSTPVTQVDESSPYAYDVNAMDIDGNTLTYSLTSAPSWLSIDATTGLIFGTAPSVSSDTDYTITVQVSDGTATATQTYTLTVHNISSSQSGGTGTGNVVSSSTDVSGTTQTPGKSEITSPPVNLGGQKASANGIWIALFALVSVLILGAGAAVIVLIRRK